MQIESFGASAKETFRQRLNIDQQVQSLFSEVLAAADLEGYLSAQPLTPSVCVGESISQTWSEWFHSSTANSRYSHVEDRATLGERFGQLLVHAHDVAAYKDPQAFLLSLTNEELAAIQQVHALAEPIQIDSLSDEGAVNLLLPPTAQIDLNHDGLTASGAGLSIRFPDSLTPPDVARAWEETTAGMDIGERMTYELQMKSPVLFANIVSRADGSFSHVRPPNDVDFVNPMADPDFSYLAAADKWIDYLEAFKNQLDPSRVARDTAFWSSFKQRLSVNEAASQ
jgi:hypothetical protein